MKTTLKSLRYLGDYRLAFTFADKLKAELDFHDQVFQRTGPIIEPLRDKRFFSQAFIDHGALTWPSGYDVCPDVLRVWAEAGSILNQRETDRRCAAPEAISVREEPPERR
jgi:hypothetical protein